VQDDGVGINLDNQNNQTGHGLSNMYERVKLLNGLIDISKGVNNGTIVSEKIPLV
jgi:signal transduction histidine kinase